MEPLNVEGGWIPCWVKGHKIKLKRNNKVKQTPLSFCCLKKQNPITFVQINDATSILARQKKVMNWDRRCENPHLWYCSCWGFCCSVPCSFEKLHRHKLKTIFNFKITEWVVKWSSSHWGSSVFLILVSTLSFKSASRKNVPTGLFEHSVSSVFFGFVLF